MRVQLEQVGGNTCVPLPPEAAEHPAFVAGQQVEIHWDPNRAQLVVRAVANLPKPAAEVEDDFLQAAEAFVQKYAQALQELASL